MFNFQGLFSWICQIEFGLSFSDFLTLKFVQAIYGMFNFQGLFSWICQIEFGLIIYTCKWRAKKAL